MAAGRSSQGARRHGVFCPSQNRPPCFSAGRPSGWLAFSDHVLGRYLSLNTRLTRSHEAGSSERGGGKADSQLPRQVRPPTPHSPQASAGTGGRDEGDLVDQGFLPPPPENDREAQGNEKHPGPAAAKQTAGRPAPQGSSARLLSPWLPVPLTVMAVSRNPRLPCTLTECISQIL